ncbi:hypothetical protein [Bacillus wiedmannii]|uniref:hypothetical protein n=1 Tax=Bacillus wiedmannii TaxID=1890302 RepID=UPI000BED656A|nr:hypothetical protein [Bacillus wiedmannii]PEF33205.1 hypothetical protein CON72_26415 [Bacillus wiedmannii]
MRVEEVKRENKIRKIRSDKKEDIKPTICSELREVICGISYITNTPIKNVGEFICEYALKSKEVVDILAKHFRRGIQIDSTCYIGDLRRKSLQRQKLNGPTERITIRFRQETYEKITALEHALDVTKSKATALLLEVCVQHTNVVNEYIKTYLQNHLDKNRMKELKKIIHYINANNPYEEEFSFTELMAYLFDEIKGNSKNIKTRITEWIDQYK